MDQQIKERITLLFNRERVDEENQNFWFTRLALLPREKQAELAEFFEILPQELPRLRSLQEQKEHVLASKDTKAWEEIIQAEKEWLAKVNIL